MFYVSLGFKQSHPFLFKQLSVYDGGGVGMRRYHNESFLQKMIEDKIEKVIIMKSTAEFHYPTEEKEELNLEEFAHKYTNQFKIIGLLK